MILISLFEIDSEKIIVQRENDIDNDGMVYYFEMEELVTEIKSLNKSQIIKDIFDLNDIEYEFVDYGIIEIDE